MPKEKDSLHVKTLEEIRLEKIQAESAAYWDEIAGGPMAWEAANPAANPSASHSGTIPGSRKSSNSSALTFKKASLQAKNVSKELDFRVLSLEEIRKNRARKVGDSQGSCGQKLSPCSNSKLLTNGSLKKHESSRELKPNLGVRDLRMKITSSKSQDEHKVMSHLNDALSSKRQRQDTSPQRGTSKKQRIQLHRDSDIEGEETIQSTKCHVVYYDETSADGHIINDIDNLLME